MMKLCIILVLKGVIYEEETVLVEQIASAIKKQELGLTVTQINLKMGVAK